VNDVLRIVLVDDHAVVRQGLAALLATTPDVEVIGEAASGEDAVPLCRSLKPDVALVDLIMPGMDGVATTQAIKAASPETRILLLTSYAEGDLVQPALAAGVDGYLLKTASAEGVVQAILSVARGQQVLDPVAVHALRDPSPDALSAREQEVLHLVAEGLSNADIAARLQITVRTVKAHISSLLQKLSLSDRTQLAIYVLQRRGRQ
jgi:NarL family two-component system response regulator LiaR